MKTMNFAKDELCRIEDKTKPGRWGRVIIAPDGSTTFEEYRGTDLCREEKQRHRTAPTMDALVYVSARFTHWMGIETPPRVEIARREIPS